MGLWDALRERDVTASASASAAASTDDALSRARLGGDV